MANLGSRAGSADYTRKQLDSTRQSEAESEGEGCYHWQRDVAAAEDEATARRTSAANAGRSGGRLCHSDALMLNIG